MKLSLNWIKEFVDIPAQYSPHKLAELLTLRTCEVESYEDQGRGLEGVVVGKMLEFKKHPNADKLNVAKVDIGRKEPLNLIFGQMVNMNVGDRVPVAVAPTTLPTGIKIEAKELRGVKSEGMLCLEQELGFKEGGVSLLYFPTTTPGTPLASALHLDDVIFEIDNKSLTHRPDLWGHYGMAREFAAILGLTLKPFEPKVIFPKAGARVKVDFVDKDIAYRFLSTIITGITVAESPQWLKNRLNAAGMRPVNNIVDITNFVMLETGYPMHAFDRTVVGKDNFVIRYAADGEIVETLDHKKRRLTNADALVTNGKEALGIAGIMGGLHSEINDSTKEILLEVGNWNPVMIRKTTQRQNLRTDAAARFEKSLDPEMGLLAFKRACELILQLCLGSKIAGPMTDLYTKKIKPISVSLDISRVNKKIGVEIKSQEMMKHLNALEFGVRKGKKGFLTVTVPTFRATKDVNIEDDLVEEIARMHGYENISPSLPSLPISPARENRERVLEHQARQIFSLALAFTETSLYSFYGIEKMKQALLPEEAHVVLQNPLTLDQTHLRVSLLPNMLTSAVQNLKFHGVFKLYEIGRTYIKQKGAYFPLEEKFICGVIVRPENEHDVFYEALGALQSFLETFGAQKGRIEGTATPAPYAHPAKCATVTIHKEPVALAYEVHPVVLKNFGIEANCGVFEINFTKLAGFGKTERTYRETSRFPGIEIDISVLVDAQTPVREVSELIRHADAVMKEQNLIADIKVIDIFTDKRLGEGKKSVTVRVLLQSPDRTLTDEEMQQVQEKISRAVKGAGFEVRG